MSDAQKQEKLNQLFRLLNPQAMPSDVLRKYIFLPSPSPFNLKTNLKSLEDVRIFYYAYKGRGKGVWTKSVGHERNQAACIFEMRSDELFIYSVQDNLLKEDQIPNWVVALLSQEPTIHKAYKSLYFDWGDRLLVPPLVKDIA